MLDLMTKLSELAREAVDKPTHALVTTGSAIGVAEAARHVRFEEPGFIERAIEFLSPYVTLLGYCVTVAVAFWWARKLLRWALGAYVAAKALKNKCKRCPRFSWNCAGCLREVLRAEGEE